MLAELLVKLLAKLLGKFLAKLVAKSLLELVTVRNIKYDRVILPKLLT
jgi:hypothetical protein